MTIRVLLFGPYAAAAGAASIGVRAEEGCTCAGLLALLADQHPPLRPLLSPAPDARARTVPPGARLAVNHEFARDDRPIRASDEVALIGMVSGG